jgi:hypothetical protein
MIKDRSDVSVSQSYQVKNSLPRDAYLAALSSEGQCATRSKVITQTRRGVVTYPLQSTLVLEALREMVSWSRQKLPTWLFPAWRWGPTGPFDDESENFHGCFTFFLRPGRSIKVNTI